MAKTIEQYTQNDFIDKESISGLANVVEIGIQTLPGVQFSFNDDGPWITVGHTGIYNLKINKAISIDSFYLNKADSPFWDKQTSEWVSGFYILIDVIREGVEYK